MTSLKKPQPVFLYLLLSGLAVWFIGNYFFGARVSYNDGYGWDGLFYGAVAADFKAYLHNFSAFYSGRILPELCVYLLGKKVFLLDFSTHEQVVNTFYIYNVFVLVLGAYFFFRLAQHFQWSSPVILIGFTTLFINFPNLRLFQYMPVLTDPTALTLGIMLAYFYVKNNLFGLIIATFLGAFTFPLIIYTSALLILFPNKNKNQADDTVKKLWESKLNKFNVLVEYIFKSLIIVFLLSAFLIGIQHYISLHAPWTLPSFDYFNLLGNFDFATYPVSFFILIVYLYLFIGSLVSVPIRLQLSKKNILFFLILVGFIYFLKVHYLINPALPNANSIFQFFVNSIEAALMNPLIFIIAHVVYYGPGILLILIFWSRIVKKAYELGTGFYLFIIFYSFFLINSQSRQFINALPFFVILLCQVLKEIKVKPNFSYKVFIVALLISKFWLPIHVSSEQYAMAGDGAGLSHFPMQLLYMSFGPWMSNLMYLIQFGVVLLILWWLLSWKQASLRSV